MSLEKILDILLNKIDDFTSLLKNIVQSQCFLTVISGVLVYIISQRYYEEKIIPKKEYKKIKQKILYILELYACYYSNPLNLQEKNINTNIKEKYDEASYETRKIASELAGYIGLMSKMKKDKKKKLEEVLSALIGLSNSYFIMNQDYGTTKENRKYVKTIKENLF